MEYQVRYLESFDSIRAAWQPGPNTAADEARAQACIETMVSLAFGYDIVIQQSFALDSLAFQYVLRDVNAAYKSVRSDKKARQFWAEQNLPIQLHLHNQTRFRGAASTVFRNIGTGNFYSHLYPELTGQQDAYRIAKDLSKSGRIFRLLECLDGDVRAELFESMWDWFGRAKGGNQRKVVTPDPLPDGDMQSLFEPILSDESNLFQGPQGESIREDPIMSKLVSAVRTLQREASDPRPFASRSRLYSDRPWSETGGPSAKDLVQEDLPLVQEVANTLYNRTTVSSIGSISVLYSTPVSGADLAADRLLAQTLALDSAACAKGAAPRPRNQPGQYVSEPSLPPLRVDIMSAEGVAGEFNKKMGPASGHTVAAFEGLLELRREPQWVAGISRINEAYFSFDLQTYRKAVLSHLEVVEKNMGRSLVVRIDADELGFTMEAPRQAGGPISALIEGSFDLPPGSAKPFVAASLAHWYPKVRLALASRSSVKEMRSAWTKVVRVPGWPTDA